MSVTVNPSFSWLFLTLRRNLPNRPVSPSSSTVCSSSSSSSSSSSFTLLVPLGCGQYSSHFWNQPHRHFEDKSGIKDRTEERGGVVSPHLVVLLESGDHDDDAAPLLPHHVPEVSNSVQHRPLGGDVGSRSSFITLRHREPQRGGQTINQSINQSTCIYQL